MSKELCEPDLDVSPQISWAAINPVLCPCRIGCARLPSYNEGKIGLALFERIKGRRYSTPEAKRRFREVENLCEAKR